MVLAAHIDETKPLPSITAGAISELRIEFTLSKVTTFQF